MRAARIQSYGPPETLRIEDLPTPAIGPNDILVDVRAASVNPIDVKVRAGYQRAVVRLKPPKTLGMDFSGTVVGVGANVQRFKVGDAVFGSPSHSRDGTYAEQLAVKASEVSLKPARLTHLEAASLPLVALTAWGCLVDAGKVREGSRVLIQAGSGGVGTAAIQIAKAKGAHVTTTCSGRNVELVQKLGADVVVDYTKERFENAGPFDIVLEAMGGEILDRSLTVLGRGGVLASINSGLATRAKQGDPTWAFVRTFFATAKMIIVERIARGVKVIPVVRKADFRRLDAIAALVDEGLIEPVIDHIFPLDKIAEAHVAVETGRTRGKVVINVDRGELRT